MKDCIGNDVNVGDVIVYFTRSCSSLFNQKAVVELIYESKYYTGRPRILVRREDAEKMNSFTRKAWLHSLNNAVKITPSCSGPLNPLAEVSLV